MTEITEEMVRRFIEVVEEPRIDPTVRPTTRIYTGTSVEIRAALAAVAPLIEEKARREEREACAALCDEFSLKALEGAVQRGEPSSGIGTMRATAYETAAGAIRARGES